MNLKCVVRVVTQYHPMEAEDLCMTLSEPQRSHAITSHQGLNLIKAESTANNQYRADSINLMLFEALE